MIMVVLFTFITDLLLRQIALSFACFVILLIHLKAKPFRQAYSNRIESVALSLLLIIAGTNMVKAAFFHSQVVPRGNNYVVIVVYEWLEAVCFGLLPLAIVVAIVLGMVVRTGSRLFRHGAAAEGSEQTRQRRRPRPETCDDVYELTDDVKQVLGLDDDLYSRRRRAAVLLNSSSGTVEQLD